MIWDLSRLRIVLLTNLAIWACVPAWAAVPAGCEVKSVAVGFAGRFQVGSWTPATVQITNTGTTPVTARLVIVAPDADGQLVRTAGANHELAPGRLHTLQARFISGRANGEIVARVESADGLINEKRFRPNDRADSALKPGLRQNTPFWGLAGIPPAAFDQAISKLPTEGGREEAGLRTDELAPELIPLKPEDLPDDAGSLASIDVLMLAAMSKTDDKQPGTFLSKLTPQQQQAIRDWVEIRGGHLLLAAGSHLTEFQQSGLGKWLQLPLEAETTLRQLDGLESFSPHVSPLNIPDTVPALRLGRVEGNVIARSLDGPLLVQAPYGFGRVTFLALDLDQPPLATWEGFGHMLRKAVIPERDHVRELRVQGAQLAKSSVNDLSSQLFAALEVFPGIARPSLWTVMGLLGIYILVIGPIDYFIVHRWLQRPHWTWFTLLIWVGLGSVLLVALSNRLNGTQLRSTQLEVVDFDETSHRLRGQSWLTLYSPQTTRTSVELTSVVADWLEAGVAAPTSPSVSWVAPAENRVGGLYREGGTQFSVREYRTSEAPDKQPAAGYSDVPLQVWSTTRFSGEWSASSSKLVESKLISSELGRLAGSIEHHLPGPLTDCLLAYANRVYMPVARRSQSGGQAELRPNFVWEIGAGQPVEQRELRGFLTQVFLKQVQRDETKAGNPEVRDLQTPYDPSRRDINYIIRMLTFHQASGGRDYTGLQHDVLGNSDLSNHLRLGRAILFGRLQQRSAEWKVGGQSLDDNQPQTFVRIVLPVDRAKAEQARPIEKPDEGIPRAQ